MTRFSRGFLNIEPVLYSKIFVPVHKRRNLKICNTENNYFHASSLHPWFEGKGVFSDLWQRRHYRGYLPSRMFERGHCSLYCSTIDLHSFPNSKVCGVILFKLCFYLKKGGTRWGH